MCMCGCCVAICVSGGKGGCSDSCDPLHQHHLLILQSLSCGESVGPPDGDPLWRGVNPQRLKALQDGFRPQHRERKGDAPCLCLGGWGE